MSWATRRTEPTQAPEAEPAQATAQPQRNARRPAKRARSTVPAPEQPQSEPEPIQEAAEPATGADAEPYQEPEYEGERPGIASATLALHKATSVSAAEQEDTATAARERDLGAGDEPQDCDLLGEEAAQGVPVLVRPRVLAWRRRVIASLRLCPNLTVAARAAGISRRNLVRAKGEDPVFERTIAEAMVAGAEMVHARFWHLGVEGHKKPVYQGGMKVGEVLEFSEKSLEMLARKHFKGEYEPASAVTVNTVPGAGGITNNVTVNVGTDLLEALHRRRRAALDGTKLVTATVIEPAQLPDAAPVIEP